MRKLRDTSSTQYDAIRNRSTKPLISLPLLPHALTITRLIIYAISPSYPIFIITLLPLLLSLTAYTTLFLFYQMIPPLILLLLVLSFFFFFLNEPPPPKFPPFPLRGPLPI